MHVDTILRALEHAPGLVRQLGIQIRLEEAEPACALTITPAHCGAPGVAHGGAIMSLMDTALGAKALTHALPLGKVASTVELKVNMLRPVHEGRSLEARAQIQSAGKTLLVLSGTAVERESGRTVAFAVGTFNLYGVDLADRAGAVERLLDERLLDEQGEEPSSYI